MKKFFPFAVLLVALAAVAWTLFPHRTPGAYDLDGFARLPVLADGRLKPFDTVARTSLLELQGRQRFVTPDNRSLSPTEWLLDVLFRADLADHYQTFRIDNLDVISLVGLRPEDGAGKKFFSLVQLEPKFSDIDNQAKLAGQVDDSQRSAFERAVIKLQDDVILYERLQVSLAMPDSSDFLTELTQFQDSLPAGVAAVRAKQAGQPHDEDAARQIVAAGQRFDLMDTRAILRPIPPDPGDTNLENWQTTGRALLGSFADGRVNPDVMAYAALGHTWRFHQPEQFNQLVQLYRDQLQKRFSPVLKKSAFEARFNAAQPFYTAMILYVFVFLLAVVSWLKWPETVGRAAFDLMTLAFVLATAGILARMWLEGRPPVTNLYSSALFIGWGAVGLCLVLEKFYHNAIGSATGGLIGFGTLLIAHHLALGGDTMEMMRAVLDSNFWLSTHVVAVTTGYAATFLSGFLALIYIFRGVFTKSLDKATADSLARMVYGVVCFATLFSFVGTVLGGIWADQSWGRFWGWDPKENGALIIVLWNALILHARWGGLVKPRGLMCLAVFGNIVTSWSWFGVNMLGIGLHSYGFTQAAFVWLSAFIVSQLAIIALANLPLDKWRSFRAANGNYTVSTTNAH
jgi:ABC-type transport system involved in cytochrome c biogenesis permease subunit